MAGISACCISGTVNLGTPQGTMTKLGGVDTYIARPAQPTTKAILLASDLFGLKLVNTKLVADVLAKEGFLTVVPDMFNGGSVDTSVMETMVVMQLGERRVGNLFSMLTSPFRIMGRVAHVAYNLVPFMMRHFPPSSKVPLLEGVVAELKKDHGIKSIATAGFCYGATPALGLANAGVADAVAIAHPAMLKVPQDLATVAKPILFICADNDDQWPEKTRKLAQEALDKRQDISTSYKFYPGTFHGFVLRGDDKDTAIAEAQQDALKQIVQWFKTHLQN